jgi:hypothetical protein
LVEVASITEPLKSNDYEHARANAIQRASKEAIASVIGQFVQSKQQSSTQINGSKIQQYFTQLDESEIAGVVRPQVVDESKSQLGESDALSFRVNVTVCVPRANVLEKWSQRPPSSVDPRKAVWFDTMSGEARLWYWKDKSGAYEFFDNKGFHPKTGGRLQPVSEKIREDWKSSEDRRERDARERAAVTKRAEELKVEKERQLVAARAAEEIAAAGREEERRVRIQRAPELCDQLVDQI